MLESNFISHFQEFLLTDFVFLNYLFIYYLFLAALRLACCTWAFSSCGHGGLLFVIACDLLIAVAFRGFLLLSSMGYREWAQ